MSESTRGPATARESLFVFLRRKRRALFGHDYEFARVDDRPREYTASGRPRLRPALAICSRCGKRTDD